MAAPQEKASKLDEGSAPTGSAIEGLRARRRKPMAPKEFEVALSEMYN